MTAGAETGARYVVEQASWQHDDDRTALMLIRRRVFIEEQQVAESEEWDEHDPACVHLLVRTTKRDAVGTARLHPSGRVQRVAVLEEHRGRGVGRLLMTAMIELARQGQVPLLRLHSQVHASGFYSRLGFMPCGEEFIEAGIAHIEMQLSVMLQDSQVIRRSQRRVLSSQQQLRAAVVEVTGVAGRMLSIFTHDLEPAIYAHDDFLEAVKRFVLSRSFTRVRVLIADPQRAMKSSNRFVSMGRRLNSYIEFRHLHEELRIYREAYLIADDSALVYRADTYEPGVARKYLSRFEELWSACEPAQELRELRI